MRKTHPPPVVIDNWPYPLIILDFADPKPKRVCGVFCIVAEPWANERGIYRGSYFSNIKAASKAMGFRRDEVGKLLQAKFEVKRRSRDFSFWLERAFPWLFEKAGSAPPKPQRKPAKLSAPARSETVLDWWAGLK